MSVRLTDFITGGSKSIRPADLPERLLAIQRNLDDTREAFEETHGERTAEILSREVRAALIAWHKTHPRRRVQFFDCMGLVSIEIDGKELSDFLPRAPWMEKRGPLAPLFQLEMWYCQVSDSNFKYCIEDITLEPIKCPTTSLT
jgi:hypothetical protein